MKIEEIKPTAREFQLTLSEDQLRVIEHALYVHDGAAATSGSVTAYSVWDKIDDALDEFHVQNIRGSK
jgi:hypothetical protein